MEAKWRYAMFGTAQNADISSLRHTQPMHANENGAAYCKGRQISLAIACSADFFPKKNNSPMLELVDKTDLLKLQ